MAHASPFSNVPDEVNERVKASGAGLIVPWAPQQAILEHSVRLPRSPIWSLLTITQATGWFVTHGGFNSIVESVYAGVPMYVRLDPSRCTIKLSSSHHRICWPFSADQPLNTVHLTENLDVAYELLEVRTGDGLKPVYRTGKAPIGTLEAVRAEAAAVLEKAFGGDGDRKRANIRKIREVSLELWQPRGASAVAAEQLLDSL